LIERAIQGEEVVIAKAGKPLVKLVKIKPKTKRILGSAAGTIEFVEGWDKPMTDEEFEEFVAR
jgi:antitoxin (DNA-binding transcriptional repressor) of toxin-antitoxin stability system